MSDLTRIIERVAIVVDDLSSTIEFYKNFLGFKLEKQYCNQEMGIRAAVLVRKTSRVELFEYNSEQIQVVKKSLSKKQLRKSSLGRGLRKITFKAGPLQKTGLKLSKQVMSKPKKNVKAFQDPNGFILEEIFEKKQKKVKLQRNRN